MWNKIFNHKSKKSSFGSGSRKDRKNKSERVNDVDFVGSRLCSDSDDTSLSTLSAPISTNSTSSSAKSKFSKVVNSFSLKRGSKENRNAVTILECNSEVPNGGAGVGTVATESRFGSLKRALSDESDRIIIRKDHARVNELLVMDEPTSDIMSMELKPCPTCTRTFVPETLKKHVNICEKMAMKKRKTFDSSKQRREGTDLANFLPKGYGLPETKRQHSLHQFHHQQESKNTIKLSQQLSSASSQTLQKQHDESHKEPTSATSVASLPLTTVTPNIQNKKSSSAVSHTATASSSIAKEAKLKAERKRNLLPPSEPCPYCERCFGIKAYDRHVEWCKEKARLLSNKNQTKTPAKERLEARIKYRAPCLKSKRTATREKYSGMGFDDTASIADSDHHKFSMSTSLSSSIMSESGISDKYDPFLSAKRQLEELCSPTSTEAPITPVTPTTPNSTKLPSSLSSSFTSSQNTRNTPTTTQSSNFRRTSSLRVSRKKTPPTHHHKSSRPIFSQSKDRPTIQRGISDEGPISSNFLKPEEYDEMPVKSACVNDIAISHYQHHHQHHPHHNSPKVVKRDPNSNVNRRNIRLNLNNKFTNDKSSSSNVGINPISKTDSLAIFLKYENDTKINNNSSPSIIDSIPIVTSPLSPSPNNLTEKDIKDKTNKNLSKNQTLSTNTKLLPSINKFENVKNNFNIDNSNNNNNNRFKEINSVMTINKIHPIKLEPISNTKIISINSLTLPTEINSNNNNNLKSIQKSTKSSSSSSSSSSKIKIQNPPSSLNLNSILNSKDTTDFIDPKLINFCDNLPINITKISDSDFTSSSSTDSVSTTKYTNAETITTTITNNIQQHQQQQQHQQHQQHQQQQQQQQNNQKQNQKETSPSSNRSSSEKRNLLNRQLRLDKNQFLYDISPDYDDDDDDDDNDDNNDVIIDSYSDQCDKTMSIIDTNDKRYNKNHHNNDEPPTFDDFDFEEFLSSFDENDEEQYPIFKDYKKFLMMNRSLNKQYDEQQQQHQQTINNNETNNNFQISLNRSPTTIPSGIENISNNDDDVEKFCDNDDLDLESHKNEIFISIETNHNDDIINSNPSLIIPLSPLSQQEQQQEQQQQQQQQQQQLHENHDGLLNDEEKDGNKTEKPNELTNKQLIDLNRNINTTKNYIEQIEKINNNENDLKNNNERNKSSSNDMMMFQLQDSDEISSSVDENFLTHDRNSGSMHSKQNAADSAYGSLSRHSPIDPMIRRNSSRQRQPITNILPTGTSVVVDQQQQQSPILKPKYSTSSLWNEPITKRRNRNFSASSSGSSSDNSLSVHHHHNNLHQSQKSEDQQQQSGKMSKFCHECGSKFILTQAKFCMECGVKRIMLE